jgi:hypothetical protein
MRNLKKIAVCFMVSGAFLGSLIGAETYAYAMTAPTAEDEQVHELFEESEDVTSVTIDGVENEVLACEVKGGELNPIESTLTVNQDSSTQENDNYELVATTNVSTKTSSGSKTKNNIKLTGRIKWIDNIGLKNTLVSVSGSIVGNVKARKYAYGSGQLGSLHTTWHKSSTSDWNGSKFNDTRNAGKEASQFILKITAVQNNDKEIVLYVKTKVTD